MDFEFSPDEQAFAHEVRAFLVTHPPETFAVEGMDAGYGSGAHSRPFLRALADQGWLTMTWPRSFGGQSRSLMYTLVRLAVFSTVLAPFGTVTRIAACAALGVMSYALAVWLLWQLSGRPRGAETMMANLAVRWLRARWPGIKSAA